GHDRDPPVRDRAGLDVADDDRDVDARPVARDVLGAVLRAVDEALVGGEVGAVRARLVDDVGAAGDRQRAGAAVRRARLHHRRVDPEVEAPGVGRADERVRHGDLAAWAVDGEAGAVTGGKRTVRLDGQSPGHDGRWIPALVEPGRGVDRGETVARLTADRREGAADVDGRAVHRERS